MDLIMTIKTTKELFNELVAQTQPLFTTSDLTILQTHDKEAAKAMLHFAVGARIREVLGLWHEDAGIKLDAIYEHANQGLLLGYDADGGSTALLGYLWDETHTHQANED